MKKLLLSGAVLSMLVTVPVLAETSTTPRPESQLKTVIDAKRAEIKDVQAKLRATAERAKEEASTTRKEVKEMRGEMRGEIRADVAKMRAMVATKVFTATLERLEKLETRIESRIAKINSMGGTTTEATNFVIAAKANIADAKIQIVAMQSVDISTASTTATTTIKANFDAIKLDAKNARELLTKAKQNLQKAVNALAKWEKMHRKTTATSTDENNNNQ